MNKKEKICVLIAVFLLVFSSGFYYYGNLKSRTVNFQGVRIVLPQDFRKNISKCSETDHSLYCLSADGYFSIYSQSFDYQLDISTKEGKYEALKVQIDHFLSREGGIEYNYWKTEFNGDAAYWVDSAASNNPTVLSKSLFFFKSGKVYSVGFDGPKYYINENWPKMEKSILNLRLI